MEILVFKTNLLDAAAVDAVAHTLSQHPRIAHWNVDLEDCDRVLRIISDGVAINEIEHLLSSMGFQCAELL